MRHSIVRAFALMCSMALALVVTVACGGSSDETVLKAAVKVANSQMPMDAGSGMTIESVELKDDAVVYQCTVDESVCTVSQIEENYDAVKEAILQSLKGESTKDFLDPCIKCNRGIIYSYTGTETGDKVEIVLTVDELKVI